MSTYNKQTIDDSRAEFVFSRHTFECKRCSRCCRKEPGIVMLTEKDVNGLLNNLNMELKVFIEKCCREVYRDDKIYIGLKEKSNYDCIFWGSNGCIVYKDRPVQCRTFPFWPGLGQSEEDWVHEKKRCPGLDSGGDTFTLEQKMSMYMEEKNAVYMEMPEFKN